MRRVISFLQIKGSIVGNKYRSLHSGRVSHLSADCHVFVSMTDDEITDKRVIQNLILKVHYATFLQAVNKQKNLMQETVVCRS